MSEKYARSVSLMLPAALPDGYTLPVDPSLDSHITLCYLGEMDDLPFTKENLLSILMNALDSVSTFFTQNIGVKDVCLFGVDENYLVLTLDDEKLLPIYEYVKQSCTQ